MGEHVIREKRVGSLDVKVGYDFFPANPREDENLGTMYTWTRRYYSPDKHPYQTPADFEKTVSHRTHIILPVYKYEHGGVAYSTESFIGRAPHAEWDSGQVGYIFASLGDVRQWFGVKRITKNVRERAENVLRGEVRDYSAYANGDVYGYIIEMSGYVIETGWGYYDVDECLNDGIREAKGVRNGNN